jgi:hypothetical protein
MIFNMLLYHSGCLHDCVERPLVVVAGPLRHMTSMSRPLLCRGRVPQHTKLRSRHSKDLASTILQTRLVLPSFRMLHQHSLRSHRNTGGTARRTVTLQAPSCHMTSMSRPLLCRGRVPQHTKLRPCHSKDLASTIL